MNERTSDVVDEPRNTVQTAQDVALDAAASILRARLGHDRAEIVVLVRIPAEDAAAHNDGFDSAIGAHLQRDADRDVVVRSLLRRALDASGALA